MRVACQRSFYKKLLTSAFAFLLYLTGATEAYEIMSWQEYKSYSYSWPYSYRINTSHGGLLYFGVEHSYRPQAYQFSQIETLWKQFRPEIAFNEGNTPPIGRINKKRSIKKYGEVGLIVFLSKQDTAHSIHLESLDPKFEEEVAFLRRRYSGEQLKVFYVLRQKSTYDRMSKPAVSLNEYLDDFIRNELRILDAPPNSITELQSIYAKYFPDKGLYRRATYSLVDPAPDPTVKETVFNEISRASIEYRDQFMIGQILRFVCQKRVLAVVGATHVVMQEPALRALLPEKCS